MLPLSWLERARALSSTMPTSSRPLVGQLTVFCESPVVPCPVEADRSVVLAGIYNKFLASFAERIKAIKVGDPFTKGVHQGPQVSKNQYDVRLPPLSFSTTKITVCDLSSASCRTSILARRRVPSSTLVVAMLEMKVTPSRCVCGSFSRPVSHGTHQPSDSPSPQFSPRPS